MSRCPCVDCARHRREHLLAGLGAMVGMLAVALAVVVLLWLAR